MESKIGVKGCINIITKYSRRHLSFFLCPAALPCSVLWEETSFPFSSGQFNPIHRSSCDEFFVVVFSKIHQMGIRSSLHGNILNVCALERVYAFMKCMWISIHPFINGRSLLEVGIVRKSINVFLNHFVAELVLLLQRGERKKKTATSAGAINLWQFSHWSHRAHNLRGTAYSQASSLSINLLYLPFWLLKILT